MIRWLKWLGGLLGALVVGFGAVLGVRWARERQARERARGAREAAENQAERAQEASEDRAEGAEEALDKAAQATEDQVDDAIGDGSVADGFNRLRGR